MSNNNSDIANVVENEASSTAAPPRNIRSREGKRNSNINANNIANISSSSSSSSSSSNYKKSGNDLMTGSTVNGMQREKSALISEATMLPEKEKCIDPESDKAEMESRQSFAWKDLRKLHMEQLETLLNEDEIELKMLEIFQIKDVDVNLRNSILLDFYVSNYMFGRNNGLNHEQISAFFTIMKYALEKCILTEKHNDISIVIDFFHQIIAKHTSSYPLFPVEIVSEIVSFIGNNFLQHYKLYLFAFTEEQDSQYIQKETMLEYGFVTYPLSAGIAQNNNHENQIVNSQQRRSPTSTLSYSTASYSSSSNIPIILQVPPLPILSSEK